MIPSSSRLALALSLLALSACAPTQHATKLKVAQVSLASAQKEGPRVVYQYLKGLLETTSHDGKIPYGPFLTVLVKRSVDFDKGLIIEETWHHLEHRETRLVRRPGTLIFDASDREKSFEGTLTFASEDWLRANVVYDISSPELFGTLKGTGTWSGDTYTTQKVLYDPTNTPSTKMKETLTLISEEEYQDALPK